MLFKTGSDLRHTVFDYCSCKALTKFASTGSCAREAVKEYLQFKLEQMLGAYIKRGTLWFSIEPVSSQVDWLAFENLFLCSIMCYQR